MTKHTLRIFIGVSAMFAAVTVQAASLVINSTDVIYAAGGNTSASTAGGNSPVAFSLANPTPGTYATSVTFSSVIGSLSTSGGNTCASANGCIVLNNGTGNNVNNADGVGAAPATSFNSGVGSISGLTAPGAGYLVGVFVAAGGPSGPAPASLNFTTGTGTSFTSLSPLLDQVFFIGDGLSGNGTGTTQVFNAPTGAVSLYLGISDACAYNGPPSCYADNLGTFTATYALAGSTSVTPTSTPEPASLTLFGSGILLVGCLGNRKARSTRA